MRKIKGKSCNGICKFILTNVLKEQRNQIGYPREENLEKRTPKTLA
jgi:hypothetical protein